MNYKITFEARSRNAQGAFYPRIVFVSAESKEEANRAAMRKLHAANFETRFPLSAEESEDFSKYERKGLTRNGVVDMEELAKQNKQALDSFMAKKKAQNKIAYEFDFVC